MKAGRRIGATLENSFQCKLPNSYCARSGCSYPKPGEWDRPPMPEVKEGKDYSYGTRMVTEKIDTPNPNYGQLKEPGIRFSDQAKKPAMHG